MSLDRQLRKFRADAAAIGEAVYRNLPPEERFRLIVQSEAANNDTEVQRLIDTCPKKTYTQRDASVIDRVEQLAALVMAFCLDLAVPLAKLQMLQGQTLLLDYLRQREDDELCYAWWKGYAYGLGGEAPEDEDVDIPTSSDTMAAKWFLGVNQRLIIALQIKVTEHWTAFARFCQDDLGLEPATVMKSCMAPMLGTVQEALAEMEGIEPDAGRVGEYQDMLGRLWHRLLGLEE
jgi:hypothetical protein